MGKSKFEVALANNFKVFSKKKASPNSSQEVLAAFEGVVGEIRKVLIRAAENSGGDVTVKLTPTRIVNIGREYICEVRSKSHGFTDFPLRAYIPGGGLPAYADWVGATEKPMRTMREVEAELLALSRELWFVERVQSLADALATPLPRKRARRK